MTALSSYAKSIDFKPCSKLYANNHIHTFYSFSPYSPTEAIYYARCAGLCTAGIIDHDTMMGAEEFIEAGKILQVATTIGVECRVSLADTRLQDFIVNNPEQKSVAYLVIHAVPHGEINRVNQFFKPYRQARTERNRAMTDKLNQYLKVTLDYSKDVVPLSRFSEGGTVTERHILYALSLYLIKTYGKGGFILDYLIETLQLAVSERQKKWLLDVDNDDYAYDLLGVLKAQLTSKIYIPAKEELPHISEVVAFAKEIDAILAYPYLGDVESSVTGDKRAQKFEDEYLDLLFEEIKSLGIKAISYMPSRNTLKQLMRVQDLAKAYNMMEISGEDINSPRQSFICEDLARDHFKHLVEATWQLIAHERRHNA